MKIKMENTKTIVYLYQYKLDFSDYDKLNKQIKNIFIKLIRIYHLSFLGSFKVDIYENKKYGYILEIEKMHDNDLYLDIIDLKINMHKNIVFYIKMDDYPLIKNIKTININGEIFINLDDVDNILEYIEFGSIERLV